MNTARFDRDTYLQIFNVFLASLLAARYDGSLQVHL